MLGECHFRLHFLCKTVFIKLVRIRTLDLHISHLHLLLILAQSLLETFTRALILRVGDVDRLIGKTIHYGLYVLFVCIRTCVLSYQHGAQSLQVGSIRHSLLYSFRRAECLILLFDIIFFLWWADHWLKLLFDACKWNFLGHLLICWFVSIFELRRHYCRWHWVGRLDAPHLAFTIK